jgi:SAM-dependent methyltransferase
MSLRSFVFRSCSEPPPEHPPDDFEASTWPQFADHVARYAFARGYAKGRRILDAGTGPGYGAAMLRAAGASRVVAVDVDHQVIAKARQRHGERGIELLGDDCEELANAAGPFDLICSFENIEHLRQPERFLAAAARLLTSEGMLIVSTPDRAVTGPFVDGRPANPHHVHEWYRKEFLEMLGHYFSLCEFRVQVKSNAIERRRQAAAALVRHLKRSNPIARSIGIASVLFRKQSYWASILDLATPSPADYPTRTCRCFLVRPGAMSFSVQGQRLVDAVDYTIRFKGWLRPFNGVAKERLAIEVGCDIYAEAAKN